MVTPSGWVEEELEELLRGLIRAKAALSDIVAAGLAVLEVGVGCVSLGGLYQPVVAKKKVKEED